MLGRLSSYRNSLPRCLGQGYALASSQTAVILSRASVGFLISLLRALWRIPNTLRRACFENGVGALFLIMWQTLALKLKKEILFALVSAGWERGAQDRSSVERSRCVFACESISRTTVSFVSHPPDCCLKQSNSSDDTSDENGNLMWHERNKKWFTKSSTSATNEERSIFVQPQSGVPNFDDVMNESRP